MEIGKIKIKVSAKEEPKYHQDECDIQEFIENITDLTRIEPKQRQESFSRYNLETSVLPPHIVHGVLNFKILDLSGPSNTLVMFGQTQ